MFTLKPGFCLICSANFFASPFWTAANIIVGAVVVSRAAAVVEGGGGGFKSQKSKRTRPSSRKKTTATRPEKKKTSYREASIGRDSFLMRDWVGGEIRSRVGCGFKKKFKKILMSF